MHLTAAVADEGGTLFDHDDLVSHPCDELGFSPFVQRSPAEHASVWNQGVFLLSVHKQC